MKQGWIVLALNIGIISLSYGQSAGVWTSSDQNAYRAVVGQVQDVCAQNQNTALVTIENQCASPSRTAELTPQACSIITDLIRYCACNQSNDACTKVCFDACDFSSCSNPLVQAYCVNNCIPDMVTLCSASA